MLVLVAVVVVVTLSRLGSALHKDFSNVSSGLGSQTVHAKCPHHKTC